MYKILPLLSQILPTPHRKVEWWLLQKCCHFITYKVIRDLLDSVLTCLPHISLIPSKCFLGRYFNVHIKTATADKLSFWIQIPKVLLVGFQVLLFFCSKAPMLLVYTKIASKNPPPLYSGCGRRQ